jgi:hypothetical protein
MIWNDPAWRESAIAWISEHVEVAGEIEQPHVRPWATAMRVPTPAGAVWFKASIPLLAHEGAVVEVLARRQPAHVPELIALDRASGWMLQGGAGTRLRELGDDAPELVRLRTPTWRRGRGSPHSLFCATSSRSRTSSVACAERSRGASWRRSSRRRSTRSTS